jgi:hypothetical protein
VFKRKCLQAFLLCNNTLIQQACAAQQRLLQPVYTMSTETCDTWAPLIGFLGVASALVFASEFQIPLSSELLVCVDLIHKLDCKHVACYTICISSTVASQRALLAPIE